MPCRYYTVTFFSNDEFLLDLINAQDTIHRLEHQLRELKAAKDELDRQQRELEELTRRLTEEREMEAAERERLVQEIAHREREVSQIRHEVSFGGRFVTSLDCYY